MKLKQILNPHIFFQNGTFYKTTPLLIKKFFFPSFTQILRANPKTKLQKPTKYSSFVTNFLQQNRILSFQLLDKQSKNILVVFQPYFLRDFHHNITGYFRRKSNFYMREIWDGKFANTTKTSNPDKIHITLDTFHNGQRVITGKTLQRTKICRQNLYIALHCIYRDSKNFTKSVASICRVPDKDKLKKKCSDFFQIRVVPYNSDILPNQKTIQETKMNFDRIKP